MNYLLMKYIMISPWFQFILTYLTQQMFEVQQAQNQLSNIKFVQSPFIIIINIDYSDQPGSHWLALRVGRELIEIFDSLGFESKYFHHYPKSIIDFISRFKLGRTVLCTPVLQPTNSKLCGLYCIFYVINRQKSSFINCLSIFSSNLKQNDQLLLSYFH